MLEESSAGEVEVVEAIVRNPSASGRCGGLYVVSVLRKHYKSLPKGTGITFDHAAWKGEQLPKSGQVVLLSGLEEFAGGWRAQHATPRKP
jgi:hypothetical protein